MCFEAYLKLHLKQTWLCHGIAIALLVVPCRSFLTWLYLAVCEARNGMRRRTLCKAQWLPANVCTWQAASRAIANSGSTSCFHSSDCHFLRWFLFRDVGLFFFGLAFLLVWLSITCNTPSSWAFWDFGLVVASWLPGSGRFGCLSFWPLGFLTSQLLGVCN